MKNFNAFGLSCASVAVLLFLFFSNATVADGVKFPSATKLYNQSDEVLLVKIIKGEVLGENDKYVGSILTSFKGKATNKIEFLSTPLNVAITPNKIGNYYIIHLKKQGDEYHFVNYLNSVIEIEKIDGSRPDLELILKGKAINKDILVTKQEYLYFPSMCSEISKVFCNSMVSIIRKLPEKKFKDIWIPKSI